MSGFYANDEWGQDPFTAPPAPASTPVTNPFLQQPEVAPSPLAASVSASAGKAAALMTPVQSVPTPVGNPFEETDAFAAPASAVVASPVVTSPAPVMQLQAPVMAAPTLTSPVQAAAPVITSPQAAKPVVDTSDFDPYSPKRALSMSAAAAAPTSPATAASPAAVVASPQIKSPAQQPVTEEASEEAGEEEAGDWGIEWKPEPKPAETAAVAAAPAVSSPTEQVAAAPVAAVNTAVPATAAATAPPEGVVLARVSTRSIFVREWKPAFWIIINQRLWIYRSKADFKPTDYIHDPFSERIKKSINLRENLRVTEMKSKMYPGETRTLYTFGIEDLDEDGGKSLLAKFAAYEYDAIKALRDQVDARVFEARHGRK